MKPITIGASLIALYYTLQYFIEMTVSRYLLVDFRCYYYAALGNFTWLPKDINLENFPGFVYAHWTAITWLPFTGMDIHTAGYWWFGIQFAVYAYFIWKLGATSYGWILVLLSTQIVAFALFTGNICVLLSAISLTPIGAAISCFYKPYLLGIVFVHLFRDELRVWAEKTFDE